MTLPCGVRHRWYHQTFDTPLDNDSEFFFNNNRERVVDEAKSVYSKSNVQAMLVIAGIKSSAHKKSLKSCSKSK